MEYIVACHLSKGSYFQWREDMSGGLSNIKCSPMAEAAPFNRWTQTSPSFSRTAKPTIFTHGVVRNNINTLISLQCLHSEKKWSQTGSSEQPFWKMAPLCKEVPFFLSDALTIHHLKYMVNSHVNVKKGIPHVLLIDSPQNSSEGA